MAGRNTRNIHCAIFAQDYANRVVSNEHQSSIKLFSVASRSNLLYITLTARDKNRNNDPITCFPDYFNVGPAKLEKQN